MKSSQVVRILTLLVSVGVLAALVWGVDPRGVIKAFEGARWGFVIATAVLNVANTGIEAVRWRLLARPTAPHVRVRSTFNALLAGTLGNVMLPLKLGDGLRAYVFSEAEAVPFSAAISTVVLDRMLDMSAFVVVAALTALVAPLPSAVARVVLWVVAGLAVGIAVLLLASRRPAGVDREAASRLGCLATQVERFRAGLSALQKVSVLVPAGGVALLSWVVKMAMVWTMFQAFHLSLPFGAPAVVLIILNLGIAVVGTPGNVGSFELASVGALKLFSVPGDVALSFAAGLHVTEVLPVVGLGLVLLWSGRLQLRRLPGAEGA